MNQKTRTVSGAAAVIMAAALLSACASGGAGSGGDGQIELEFWDAHAKPTRSPIWESIIDDFEKENPDITVKYVGLPADSSAQKLDTALATNSGPDIAFLPDGDVPGYFAQGALVALDDYLADSSLELNPSLEETVRSYVPDDKLYAIATHDLPEILWVRPPLFEAAGLDLPTSYDEFYEDAEKLTDKDSGQFGFTLRGGAGSTKQLGVDLYNSSGIQDFWDDSGKTTLNDPANVEALEEFAALYKTATPESNVTNSFPDMQAEFQSGNIAMMHHSIGSAPVLAQTFDESEAEAVPFPPAEEGGPHLSVKTSAVLSLALMSASEHQDAAWKFLEFAMSPENNSAIAQEAGGVPGNSSVDVSAWSPAQPAVVTAGEFLSDPETVSVNFPVYLPELGSIYADTEADFQRVLYGELSAQDFLDKFAGMINDAQAAYEEQK